MANILEEFGGFVRKVKEAKLVVQEAESAQNQFIVKNLDDLMGRGIVTMKIREGRLFQQMDHEMGRERALRVLG